MLIYGSTGQRTGQRGSRLHKAIVDWTRFDLMPYIRTVFPDTDWDCIYWDQFMMAMLGTAGQGGTARRNALCPDGLWIYDSGSVVIEVGRCSVNKWHKDQQVLHVGFDGQVNVVNPKDGFIVDVAGAVEDYIVELMSPAVPECVNAAEL